MLGGSGESVPLTGHLFPNLAQAQPSGSHQPLLFEVWSVGPRGSWTPWISKHFPPAPWAPACLGTQESGFLGSEQFGPEWSHLGREGRGEDRGRAGRISLRDLSASIARAPGRGRVGAWAPGRFPRLWAGFLCPSWVLSLEGQHPFLPTGSSLPTPPIQPSAVSTTFPAPPSLPVSAAVWLLPHLIPRHYVPRHWAFAFFSLTLMRHVTQLVKKLFAILETWAQFLGQEDPLEKA